MRLLSRYSILQTVRALIRQRPCNSGHNLANYRFGCSRRNVMEVESRKSTGQDRPPLRTRNLELQIPRGSNADRTLHTHRRTNQQTCKQIYLIQNNCSKWQN